MFLQKGSEEMKQRRRIKNMTYAALGAVLFCICGFVTVPFAIPFTMQTFALFFLLDCFGGKKTLLSVLIYIALGCVGLPVFSGFGSGFGVLFGATGGFIIGFAVASCVYFAAESIFSKSKHSRIIFALVALTACYICGTLWGGLYIDSGKGFLAVLSLYVFPYILPDILKLALALTASSYFKRFLSLN